MSSDLWIELVDDFISKNTKSILKTVIAVDNASFHTSKLVKEKVKEWEKNNVFLHYLKPYCSELNPIEIVWRFIKHKWLSYRDYLSKNTLNEAIDTILAGFGKEYCINFK